MRYQNLKYSISQILRPVNDQSERVPLPNLKNKKLHILIPNLLQLSVYNRSYGEICYPYPTILSPELTRY